LGALRLPTRSGGKSGRRDRVTAGAIEDEKLEPDYLFDFHTVVNCPLRGTFGQFETIQRRLAWPLH
jgi:hypothetical protein